MRRAACLVLCTSNAVVHEWIYVLPAWCEAMSGTSGDRRNYKEGYLSPSISKPAASAIESFAFVYAGASYEAGAHECRFFVRRSS